MSLVYKNKHTDQKKIVSLTTYEPRLYETYLAIESIMQQTVKANRIILWLPDSLKTTTLPNTFHLANEYDALG